MEDRDKANRPIREIELVRNYFSIDDQGGGGGGGEIPGVVGGGLGSQVVLEFIPLLCR